MSPLLVFLFLAPQAEACGDELPGTQVEEVLGWTADGRHFAWRFTRRDEQAEGRFVGVLDTRTDRTATYLIEIDEDDPETIAAVLAAWKPDGDAAAWSAFSSSHPTQAPSAVAQTCGGAELVTELLGANDYPDAPAVLADWQGTALPVPLDGILHLGVRVGGATWSHAELPPGHWWTNPRVQALWSPDCRYVAWVLHGVESYAPGVSIYNPENPVLVRPAGPVIHIMAHRTATETVEPIFDALTKAGFAPHVGPRAIRARTATVIYARGHAREAALEVAAKVPGGATVEPLNWPSPADIIVAAGTSAAP